MDTETLNEQDGLGDLELSKRFQFTSRLEQDGGIESHTIMSELELPSEIEEETDDQLIPGKTYADRGRSII